MRKRKIRSRALRIPILGRGKRRDLLDVTPPEHVQGSHPDFPYTMHTVTIPGDTKFRTREKAAPLWDQLADLDSQIERHKLRTVQAWRCVLDWIRTIEDSRTRRIFKLRYLDGKSWQQIANAFGNEITQEEIRKIHNRFLKKT